MHLSPSEEQIIAILRKAGKKITTKQLKQAFYARREAPQYAQIFLSNLLRNLEEKTAGNNSKFKIKRSPRRGPYPSEVWIEEK